MYVYKQQGPLHLLSAYMGAAPLRRSPLCGAALANTLHFGWLLARLEPCIQVGFAFLTSTHGVASVYSAETVYTVYIECIRCLHAILFIQ